MVSSKILFKPDCVSAEHSKKLTAPKRRAAAAPSSGVTESSAYFVFQSGEFRKSLFVPTKMKEVVGAWWRISGTHCARRNKARVTPSGKTGSNTATAQRKQQKIPCFLHFGKNRGCGSPGTTRNERARTQSRRAQFRGARARRQGTTARAGHLRVHSITNDEYLRARVTQRPQAVIVLLACTRSLVCTPHAHRKTHKQQRTRSIPQAHIDWLPIYHDRCGVIVKDCDAKRAQKHERTQRQKQQKTRR
jgi:hypothetical protein